MTTQAIPDIDYSRFEPPPGHFTVSTMEPQSERGNTAIMSNADALTLSRRVFAEVATYEPARRLRTYELAKNLLVSDAMRSADSSERDALAAMALIYVGTHPDKKQRKQMRSAIQDGLKHNGCHVEFRDYADNLVVFIRAVKSRHAA